MTKYAMDMFFEDNPKTGKNWLKQYLENAIKNSPEDFRAILEEKYNEHKEIIGELDLWYSNDYFIHLIMSQFIDETDEITRNELKEVYIGKKNSDEVNAIAHEIDPDYKGYLITFNFELEYQLFNLSEVIASEILLCTSKDEESKKLIGVLLISNIKALPDQSELGLYIQSKLPEQIRKTYSDFTMYAYLGATAFVLAHEIGHHFLKHTNQQNNSILPFRNHHIRGGNINHEYEFAADEYALDLMLQCNKKKSLKFEYLAGPFIAIITLAFEDSAPDKSNDSHPSLKDRYFNIKDKIRNYCSEEQYETLLVFTERIIEHIHGAVNPWNDNQWWK
ncbi:hypothetical protein [Bacillus paranthracis]|uniref:hypothetical protein n=1 Tax=Bacillus paranthracis TaxID=2026186 RepID=UPI0022E1C983|nr:hypothetical protein [Bacillus paranthracis]